MLKISAYSLSSSSPLLQLLTIVYVYDYYGINIISTLYIILHIILYLASPASTIYNVLSYLVYVINVAYTSRYFRYAITTSYHKWGWERERRILIGPW